MDFVPDWAPNVHPMFVHFPIGLLMTAVALDALSLLPRTQALRQAVPVLYVVGAVTAIATYFTGQAAADGLTISADAEPLLSEHADFALWTVIFFGIFAAVRAATAWLVPNANLMVRSLFVVIAVGGMVLIWETAERGSEMVYVHAVAVQQNVPDPEPQPEVVHTEHALEVQADGWLLAPSSAPALAHERIRWLEGDPSMASTADNGGGVTFELDGGSLMFVVDETIGDVQFTVDIDRSDFAGRVSLLHHLEDGNTYDHLTLSDEGAILGRIEDGAERAFDQGSTNYDGWMSVRVTGDGTHFRGYVDDRMIVHGHTDSLPAGRVGLRLEGEGEVRIRRLQARAL